MMCGGDLRRPGAFFAKCDRGLSETHCAMSARGCAFARDVARIALAQHGG